MIEWLIVILVVCDANLQGPNNTTIRRENLNQYTCIMI